MSLRTERIAKGLCPNCGAEAAPYRLCDRCHQLDQVGRALRAMCRAGAIEKLVDSEDRRRGLWRMLDRDACHNMKYYGLGLGERAAPRIRGVPVDVERELLEMMVRIGRPVSIEEIYEAWGRMRLRRGRLSAAADLANIIRGREKQAAKLARRAARYRKGTEAKVRDCTGPTFGV